LLFKDALWVESCTANVSHSEEIFMASCKCTYPSYRVPTKNGG